VIAYTVLETLHCDAGSSRPYLWTELLVIDDDTIGSIGAGLRNHGNRDVRTVLTDHLGAGASVAVPESVARLGTRFRTGLQQRVLILVVLLLDQRDTPGFAMATGHSLFLSAVRDEVSANLLALNGPDGPDRDALIATITKRVSDRVTNAISDELSALDKASIFVGIDGGKALHAAVVVANPTSLARQSLVIQVTEHVPPPQPGSPG